MIDRTHVGLSVARQSALVGVSRSSACDRLAPAAPAEMVLMAPIDRQYLAGPSYRSRRMRA